ncbi:sigma 54-interacting transcriptional regulator [Polyangium jinanense]|uniref:Sigma-54-dependent Fis family transcriptional regulator n=1 Tax=Polyangium jinanense TaxID=2829994 RepID=A0A9X4AUW4_9BACT|nr:sigma 54-interacting transcriptional regulator [Polyangium jinanense]MDC3957468.1 sigma-54-dependent Fis family transcriptional regulator [Polyangium jinanense]MDC3985041.1 sigma-54-dependent Fis family transcriptional regulator [Polyangium jinanense]
MQLGPSRSVEKTTLVGQGTAAESGADGSRLALTILYHPNLERVGERAILEETGEGGSFAVSRVEPVFAPPGQASGAPLFDEHLSRKPVRIVPVGKGGVRIELGESTTSVTLRGKRVSGNVYLSLRRGVVIDLGHRVVLLLHRLASLDGIPGTSAYPERHALVGESEGLRRVFWDIRSVADLELPILLRGETGTGKELVAHAIHQASRRRDKPFVAVNLGAIAPSLAIAELFGAERGAYTGSVGRRVGYFEQARGGTLFLDEIGEAPVELQVALLRVLETGELQTVGAAQSRKSDARIIAATDADLEGKVASGSFRAALLNRLAAYEICIPPLRERRDDVGRLFVHFLREELEEIGESERLAPPAPGEKLWLPPNIVVRLAEYDWPGNVRQLRNVVRQLVIGNRGRPCVEITPAIERALGKLSSPSDLCAPASMRDATLPRERIEVNEAAPAGRMGGRRKPADVTETELREALRASRWDLASAAEQLGIPRASMYLLIERFPGFRTAGDLDMDEIVRCQEELGGDLRRMAERLEVSARGLARRLRELGLARP